MNVEGASMAHQGVNQRRKLEEMNLEQVADEMALGPTSYNHHAAQAEFARRQAVWQRDAAKATQQSACYMFWLALGIWITMGLLALFTFLLWYAPQTPTQW
jgi:hypothetical protein